jgi:hypothetical protein
MYLSIHFQGIGWHIIAYKHLEFDPDTGAMFVVTTFHVFGEAHHMFSRNYEFFYEILFYLLFYEVKFSD